MKKIWAYLSRWNPGHYCALSSVILALISCLLYAKGGINEFNPSLAPAVFVSWALGAAAGVVSLFFAFRLLREGAFLFLFYGGIAYSGSQSNYIANVLTAIDGSRFSAMFLATWICSLLSFIAMFVSIFFAERSRKDVAKCEVISRVKEDDHHA